MSSNSNHNNGFQYRGRSNNRRGSQSSRGGGGRQNQNHHNNSSSSSRYHPYQEERGERNYNYSTSYRESRNPDDMRRRNDYYAEGRQEPERERERRSYPNYQQQQQQQQYQRRSHDGFHPEYNNHSTATTGNRNNHKEFAAVVSLLNPDLSLEEDILVPLIQSKKCPLVHTPVVRVPYLTEEERRKRREGQQNQEEEDYEQEEQDQEDSSTATAGTTTAAVANPAYREYCLVMTEHPADEHFRLFQERGCRLRYLRPLFIPKKGPFRESHVLFVDLREILKFNPDIESNPGLIREQLEVMMYYFVQIGWIRENDFAIYISTSPRLEAFVDLNERLNSWKVAMICSWLSENRWCSIRSSSPDSDDGRQLEYFTQRVRVNYSYKLMSHSSAAGADADADIDAE
jgi:hypothetical protein